MHGAIDFDDEACIVTEEVGDELAYGMLTAEFASVQLAIAQ